jgi:hypothetical protein
MEYLCRRNYYQGYGSGSQAKKHGDLKVKYRELPLLCFLIFKQAILKG